MNAVIHVKITATETKYSAKTRTIVAKHGRGMENVRIIPNGCWKIAHQVVKYALPQNVRIRTSHVQNGQKAENVRRMLIGCQIIVEKAAVNAEEIFDRERWKRWKSFHIIIA